MKEVAVLGLGTMGIGMAINLAKAGFAVRGFNRSLEKGRRLEEAGGRLYAEPDAAVEGVDAVVACLSNDDAARSVVLDRNLPGRMSSGALFIDSGTTGLGTTAALHDACSAKGVEFLDAPMTGSMLGAESGRLTFMVGGPETRVARARPLFDAMGRHVVHAGGQVGDGQRIKVCLNMTQAIIMQGVLEGYALAKAQGLPIERLAEVFENSAGKTGVGSFKTPYLQAGDLTPHFRLDLMQKDLHLALTEAGRARQPVPLGHAVASLYDLAARRGWGPQDFLATAKLLGLLDPRGREGYRRIAADRRLTNPTGVPTSCKFRSPDALHRSPSMNRATMPACVWPIRIFSLPAHPKHLPHLRRPSSRGRWRRARFFSTRASPGRSCLSFAPDDWRSTRMPRGEGGFVSGSCGRATSVDSRP